jgi:hypothetical protein
MGTRFIDTIAWTHIIRWGCRVEERLKSVAVLLDERASQSLNLWGGEAQLQP